MSTYKNISSELRGFFSNHPVFRLLLPLDMIFLFGGLGLIILNYLVSVGGLLSALSYYGFLFGLLLAYTNFNQKFLYLGFFIYAGTEAFSVIKYAIFYQYRFLDFYSLVTCLVFGGLGYLVFKYNNSYAGVTKN